MSKHLNSFDDILALWPSHKELSQDFGVPYPTAQAMRRRRSIGVQHWPALLQLLNGRGINLTADDLLRMKNGQRADGEAA